MSWIAWDQRKNQFERPPGLLDVRVHWSTQFSSGTSLHASPAYSAASSSVSNHHRGGGSGKSRVAGGELRALSLSADIPAESNGGGNRCGEAGFGFKHGPWCEVGPTIGGAAAALAVRGCDASTIALSQRGFAGACVGAAGLRWWR